MVDRKEVIERLISRRKIVPCDTLNVAGDCWLYTRGGSTDGYGKISVDGNNTYVHRVAAFLWKGIPLDSPLLIRHDCIGVKRCFNPDHLRPGTDLDNNLDTVNQGRHRSNYESMSEPNVRRMISAVRRGKITIASFAAKKGIAYTTALRAYTGRTHTAVARDAHSRLDKRRIPPFDPFKYPGNCIVVAVRPGDDPDYLEVTEYFERVLADVPF